MNLASQLRKSKSHRTALKRRFKDVGLTAARNLMVRTLRLNGLHHAISGRPAVVGFILKASDDADVYMRSIKYLAELKSDRNLTGLIDILRWGDGKSSRRNRDEEAVAAEALVSNDFVFGFASDANDFPSLFRLAADGIVELPPIDVAALRAAMRNSGLHFISDEVLNAALHIPLRVLSVLTNRRRHIPAIAQSLTQAAALIRSERAGTSRDEPSLEDLDGYGDAATWGRELATDLRAFRAGDLSWADVDRGILLSGPTGTGKTTFARALARTCDVPIHIHSLARWQSKGYLNDLLKAMRSAFSTARAAAPSILFIDELDSFGDRGSLSGRNENYERMVINALLECLDGADDREGVIVVGATNMPEAIDNAILRPGRLGKHIRIPLPNATARIGILRHYSGNAIPQECMAEISERLDGASGAVIEQVVRDARRQARTERRPLCVADIERFLPTQVVQDNVSFAVTCVHEAGHVVVGHLLGREAGQRIIEGRVVRNIKHDGTSGWTEFQREPPLHRNRASYLAELTILLGGIAAENLRFGAYTDAAGGTDNCDLHRATLIATRMELSLGLGGDLIYSPSQKPDDLLQRLQDDARLRRRVAIVLDACLRRAIEVMTENATILDCIADILSRKGTITAAEIETL
jgi:DNA polymerase III delta prime subunit